MNLGMNNFATNVDITILPGENNFPSTSQVPFLDFEVFKSEFDKVMEPRTSGIDLSPNSVNSLSPPFLGFTLEDINGRLDNSQKYLTVYNQIQEKLKLEKKRERNRLAAAKCRRKKLESQRIEEEKIAAYHTKLAELNLRRDALEGYLNCLTRDILDHMQLGCFINIPTDYLRHRMFVDNINEDSSE